MKYILDTLKNKEATFTDILFAIDVYAVFMKNGFVDTYFEKEGTTMLHFLIDNHSSEAFSKLFLQEAGPVSYMRNLEGVSPLKHAKDTNKM